MSFRRVRSPKELDKLISEISSAREKVRESVLDYAVDKEFATQEQAAAQKPTTDAIAGVTEAVMSGLSSNAGKLDSIIANLFDTNTNESIISLLKQVKPIVEQSGADLGQVLLTIESLKSGSNRRQDDIIAELKKLPGDIASQVVAQNSAQNSVNAQTANILSGLTQALAAISSSTPAGTPASLLSTPARVPVTPGSPSFSTPTGGPPATPYVPPPGPTNTKAQPPNVSVGPITDGIQSAPLPLSALGSSSSSSSSSASVQSIGDADDAATLASVDNDTSKSPKTSTPTSPDKVQQEITQIETSLQNPMTTEYSESLIKSLTDDNTRGKRNTALGMKRYEFLAKLIQKDRSNLTKSEIQTDGTIGIGKVDLDLLKRGILSVSVGGKEVFRSGADGDPVNPLIIRMLALPLSLAKKKGGVPLPPLNDDTRGSLMAVSRILVATQDPKARGQKSNKFAELRKPVYQNLWEEAEKEMKAQAGPEKEKTGSGLKGVHKIPMTGDGIMGNIRIDVPALGRGILKVYKGSQQIANRPAPPDLAVMLSGKSRRRKFDPEAVALHEKLLKHAGKMAVPAASPAKTRKSRAKSAADPAVRVYSDPDEVIQRLYVLLGERNAGNTNVDVSNEISQLIDWLWRNDHITEEQVKELAHASGLLG